MKTLLFLFLLVTMACALPGPWPEAGPGAERGWGGGGWGGGGGGWGGRGGGWGGERGGGGWGGERGWGR